MIRFKYVLINDRPIRISNEAWKLAEKFGWSEMPDIVQHIECGLHSGCKPCCVLFTTFVRVGGFMQTEFFDEAAAGYCRQHHGDTCHMLCPACMLANPCASAMKPCNCQVAHRDEDFTFTFSN